MRVDLECRPCVCDLEWLAIAGGEEDAAIFERLPYLPRHGQSLKVTHTALRNFCPTPHLPQYR